MFGQKMLLYMASMGIGLSIITTDIALDTVYRYAPVNPKTLKTVEYHPKELNKEDITYLKELSKKDHNTIIKEISTPEEARFYIMTNIQHCGNSIDSILYGENDYWTSFKRIHKNKKDDCDGGAIAGAALLHDNGYPAYILRIYKQTHNKEEGHVVFLFEDNNKKFYSLGYNPRDNMLKGKDTIEELITHIMGETDWQYKIIDIAKKHPDFINNDINNRDM